MSATVPPDSNAEEAPDLASLIGLLKLATLISRPMQEELASRHDLSINEARVMMCVANEGPIGGYAIAERMAMPAMNVSRALAALNARGWTELVPDPRNGRRRPVRLSAAGNGAYRSMLPDLAGIAGRLFDGLDPSERASLDRAIALMVDHIETW